MCCAFGYLENSHKYIVAFVLFECKMCVFIHCFQNEFAYVEIEF